LLQRILDRATALTGSADSSVMLYDEKKEVLYFAHATGPSAATVLERWGKNSDRGIPIAGSKAGKVFATGLSVIVNAATEDPNHFKDVDSETERPTESMICVPMSVMGKRIGVVQLLNKQDARYTPRDVLLLEHFAEQAGVAIRNAQLFHELMAHMGFYAAWSEEQGPLELLSEVARPAWNEVLSVLFAGMRGFTQLCHVIGDPQRVQQILNEFLGMLADAVIRRRGVVNKFHGDGLVALFRGPQHVARAVECAGDIVQSFGDFRARLDERINAQLGFLDVGVGVATDSVILGSVGSAAVRSFGAVGTAVNLASHLMEHARGGRRILVDKMTFRAARAMVEEFEGPQPFVLKKPGQEIGHPFELFHIKSLSGFGPERRDSPPAARATVDIFISYSHKDKAWLDQLQIHLKPYVRAGSVRTWDDTRIGVGAQWRAEIKRALASAKVAVLLVSPDFLDSEFVAANELPPLLMGEKERGLKILWVPLSASSYDETEIGAYQAALEPTQPLDRMTKGEQNKALVELCKKIKAATGP
jgi:class 3 adenylate cyclase